MQSGEHVLPFFYNYSYDNNHHGWNYVYAYFHNYPDDDFNGIHHLQLFLFQLFQLFQHTRQHVVFGCLQRR